MVRLSGLEPETFRLSGGCSNQLSYRRIKGRPLVGSRVKMAVRPPSLAQAGHGIIGYRLSKTGLHRGIVRYLHLLRGAWIGNAIAAVGRYCYLDPSCPEGCCAKCTAGHHY